MLDKAQCRSWADAVKSAPEGFTAFKFGFGGNPEGGRGGAGGGGGGRASVQPDAGWRGIPQSGQGYGNLREALGDDIDIAMHCIGQFDTRSAIGLCKAVEPIDPMRTEDPLTVRYSEAWLELQRSTRVPLLAGEKVELLQGFRP
jgi:L-alanine-DL-glutamate epimerase-like enolase superfamily enzyme